jgi:hypothetical protein
MRVPSGNTGESSATFGGIDRAFGSPGVVEGMPGEAVGGAAWLGAEGAKNLPTAIELVRTSRVRI